MTRSAEPLLCASGQGQSVRMRQMGGLSDDSWSPARRASLAASWAKSSSVGGTRWFGRPPGPALDITDRNAVSRLVRDSRPEGIAHLAAVAFGGAAAADPRLAIRTYIEGTLDVLEASELLDSTVAVLVVSSSEVYAASGAPDPLSETSLLGPRALYGHAKLAGEGAAAMFSSRGTRVGVVRPFNHTGPGQRPPYVGHPWRRASWHSFRASPLDVTGNTHVWRDIGDVRDTVRAYGSCQLLARRTHQGPLGWERRYRRQHQAFGDSFPARGSLPNGTWSRSQTPGWYVPTTPYSSWATQAACARRRAAHPNTTFETRWQRCSGP